MTAPEHDPPLSPSTALIPQPHGGALRPGGVSGNRGGRGRPKQRLVIAAGKDLATELKRLKRAAEPEQRTVTCPCGCQHSFRIDVIRGMDARTRIAYAQLLAALQASDPDAGEKETMIMVATGSPADMIARVGQLIEGVELVDGTQLEPTADAPADPKSGDGAPDRTLSGPLRG